MSDLMQSLSDLQVNRLVPVGLLFLCGAVIWAAGRRVMRVGFAAAGLLVGGVLGAVMGESGDLGVEPWIAGVCGAVAFAIVAALAYRLALAACVGLLLAMLAPMGVWTAEHQGLIVFRTHDAAGDAGATQPVLATDAPRAEGGDGAAPATPPPSAAREPMTVPGDVQRSLGDLGDLADRIMQPGEGAAAPESHPGIGGGATASTGTDPAADDGVATHLAKPLKSALVVARRAWNEAEAPVRGSFVAAGLLGAVIGLVVGTSAPMFSATLVSALGGSFLLLASGWIIGARIGIAERGWLPQTPTQWTILWLLTAVAGLAIQWMFRPRRKAVVVSE